MVYSKVSRGDLSMEGSNRERISSDEKIKSLKILYDSNAQGNIGRIKRFLSDSSDEDETLRLCPCIPPFEKEVTWFIYRGSEKD